MRRSWLSWLIYLLVFVGPFVGRALAIDPECTGLTGEPPIYQGCQLKMGTHTATLRFCSPQHDTDGDILPTGSLQSCTVTVNSLVTSVAVTDPGVIFTVDVSGKNPGHTIEGYCTNADGIQGETWVSDICFPGGKPAKPHWKDEQ